MAMPWKHVGSFKKICHVDWEKIFTVHLLDKSHASRIYKEFSQTNNKKTNNPVLKLDKRLKQMLHKRRSKNGQ